jgi:hypothetical protein
MATQKDYITVVACTSAAGEKLPFAFIASGKTAHVKESQNDAVEGH